MKVDWFILMLDPISIVSSVERTHDRPELETDVKSTFEETYFYHQNLVGTQIYKTILQDHSVQPMNGLFSTFSSKIYIR